jgi:hypothetical protein
MTEEAEKSQKFWKAIFDALSGKAEDPLAVADMAEDKASDLEWFLSYWCIEEIEDGMSAKLKTFAKAIRHSVSHKGDWLGFSCAGGNAFCIMHTDPERTARILDIIDEDPTEVPEQQLDIREFYVLNLDDSGYVSVYLTDAHLSGRNLTFPSGSGHMVGPSKQITDLTIDSVVTWSE